MVSRGQRVERFGASVVVAILGMWLLAGPAHAAQPLGTLTQLPGTAGCFTFNGSSEDGAGTCTQARGIAAAESATVSPDGANVYVASYAGVSLEGSFAVFSRNRSNGALTQLSGTAGCLTPDGSSNAGPGTCTKARGLTSNAGDGHDVAFTSDGRWAYLVAQNNGSGVTAVMIFQRDPATGALTQLPGTAGCITKDGSSQDGAGTCQTDGLMQQDSGISISSDARFVYVIDYATPTRVHVFSRNTSTGALMEAQCIAESPALSGCSTGRVLGNNQFVAISPDGTHAYSGDYQHGISVFGRNPSTGLLTQKAGVTGCITDNGKDDTGASTCSTGRVLGGTYPITIAPNGATLYDPAGADKGFSVFHINGDGTLSQLTGTGGCVTIDGKDNTGTATCATARAIVHPYGAAIAPDGSSLYISQDANPGGVAAFSLDPSTGIATQLPGLAGCTTTDGTSNGTAGQCVDGTALGRGYGMTISPDGTSVYQSANAAPGAGLGVFARENPVCQVSSAATHANDAVTVRLQCLDTDGDPLTRSIASSPGHGTVSSINNTAGTITYTPAHGFRGTDTFRFVASDGTNVSAPATATITVGVATLTKLQVSPKRFSLAGRKVKGRCVKQTKKNRGRPACKRPIKLKIVYTLSAAASVTFALKLKTTGRRVKGRCVKETSKNKSKTRCKLLKQLKGSITVSGKAGANQFTFKGKIGGHKLRPGTYQLIATPVDGTPQTETFKIVR